MSADIDNIRARHELAATGLSGRTNCVLPLDIAGAWAEGHTDRGALLAEVDRLTAELAESRAAYDEVCRMVGTGALRPSPRPAVGSIIVDSNGNEAVVLGYNDAGVALIGTAPGHIEDARRQADGGAA